MMSPQFFILFLDPLIIKGGNFINYKLKVFRVLNTKV